MLDRIFSFRIIAVAFLIGLLFAMGAELVWKPLVAPAFFLGAVGTYALAVLNPANVMRCPHCGKRAKMGTSTCHHCGRALITSRAEE
jgi:hypothetical protein